MRAYLFAFAALFVVNMLSEMLFGRSMDWPLLMPLAIAYPHVVVRLT